MGHGWSGAGVAESARREFIGHGFEGASINRIIDSSPLSRATFYKHYDSKLRLFLLTVIDVLIRFGEALPADDPSAPFWPAVSREIAAGHAYGRSHPDDVVLLHEGIRIAAEHPADPLAAAIVDAVRAHTRTWVQRGRRLGEVRTDLDVELAIDLVISTVQTLDRRLLAQAADDRDADRIADGSVDLIRRMLTP